jgi:hypothetical protein
MFLFVRGLAASTESSFLALALVSWVALPALAGFRVSRAAGSLFLAAVGGAAVSAVTLICAAISELLFTRDALAFGGLAIATLLIALPIQGLFGFVAGWAARHRASGGA